MSALLTEKKNVKIALVDDEEDFLIISEKMLKKQNKNYQIVPFNKPISLLNAIENEKEEPFDVVISDYDMPEMNGLDLLTEIRKEQKLSFIMITGKGKEEIIIEALNKGVDYYLQKSNDTETFFTELTHFISRSIEKKIMENQLIELRNLYKTLVDLSPTGILIHINGTAVFCNKALVKMLGYKNESSLIGKKIFDHIHDDYKELISEKIHMVENNIDTSFKIVKIKRINGKFIDVETSGRMIKYKGKDAIIVYIQKPK